MNVTCPYCHQMARFMESSAPIYHGRDYGPVYVCLPCGAWVGCHDGTHKPLGRLADAELRKAKQAAHKAFDPMWQGGKRKGGQRTSAYKWLADKLGISVDECHIGMFDVDQCNRVVELCASGAMGE